MQSYVPDRYQAQEQLQVQLYSSTAMQLDAVPRRGACGAEATKHLDRPQVMFDPRLDAFCYVQSSDSQARPLLRIALP